MNLRLKSIWSVICTIGVLSVVSSCASIIQFGESTRELSLLDILSSFDKAAEIVNRQQKARIRPDSLDAIVSQYWQSRDPTPGTVSNEYRDRLQARFEEGKYRYTPAGASGPDDRIIPFVLYGEPVHIYRYPALDSDIAEIWTYAPRGDVETPDFWLLPETGFRVGFQVYEGSRYRLEPRRYKSFPISLLMPTQRTFEHPVPTEVLVKELNDLDRYHDEVLLTLERGRSQARYLPYQKPLAPLESHEAFELELVLLDERRDPSEREDVIWYLGVDPGFNGLRVLLRNLDIEDPMLQHVIRDALHPLRFLVEEGDTQKPVWERGGSVSPTVWSRSSQPTTEPPSDPTLLANKILLIYSPSYHLSPDEVVRLTYLRDHSDSLRFANGWLSPEDAERVFSGPLRTVRDMVERERFEEAHELLAPLLRSTHARSAEALHLDALAMMESEEPGGRLMAEEAIRRALRLDPRNLRYHMTLARIYWKRTFDLYAENKLNRILKRAPYIADAYALKAVMRLELYWAVGMKAGGLGTPLEERGMTPEEYLDNAMNMLNSALTLDPDNPTATWWLGLHMLKMRDWVGAVQAMSYIIREGTHRGEALMGRGLALQHLGLLDLAASDYQSGLALLNQDIRFVADNPRWLLPPSAGGYRLGEEIECDTATTVEASGSADDLTATPDTFWRARDPLFSTSRNERVLEQHRRLAHVIWHFARPDLGLKGWETHRGQVYLRYGEPLQDFDLVRRNVKRKIQAQLGYIPELHAPIYLPGYDSPIYEFPNMLPMPPRNTWIYPGFEVRFWTGMVTGKVRVIDVNDYEALNEIVPASDHIVGFRDVRPLRADWYAFLDEDGRPEYVPVADISPIATVALDESGSTTLHYTVNLLLLDEEWNVLNEIETSLTPAWTPRGLHGQWIGPFIHRPPAASAGLCSNAAVEIVGPGEMAAYTSRDSLPGIGQGELSLSSLIMATETGSLEGAKYWPTGSYLIRGERAIVPLSKRSYVTEIPLSLYFEVYGLSRDIHGATDYEVTYTITALDRGNERLPLVEALFGLLVRRQERQDSVSLIFAYSGINGRVSHEFRTVFPQTDTAGRYLITIEIHDRIANVKTQRSTVIGQPR